MSDWITWKPLRRINISMMPLRLGKNDDKYTYGETIKCKKQMVYCCYGPLMLCDLRLNCLVIVCFSLLSHTKFCLK